MAEVKVAEKPKAVVPAAVGAKTKRNTKDRLENKVAIVLRKLDTLSRMKVNLSDVEAGKIKGALQTAFVKVGNHLDILVANPVREKREKVSFTF